MFGIKINNWQFSKGKHTSRGYEPKRLQQPILAKANAITISFSEAGVY